jgi:hypothetical protein
MSGQSRKLAIKERLKLKANNSTAEALITKHEKRFLTILDVCAKKRVPLKMSCLPISKEHYQSIDEIIIEQSKTAKCKRDFGALKLEEWPAPMFVFKCQGHCLGILNKHLYLIVQIPEMDDSVVTEDTRRAIAKVIRDSYNVIFDENITIDNLDNSNRDSVESKLKEVSTK